MSSDYKDKAKRLRELGLLPKHYSVNKLGESEKRHIRRLYAKYQEPVNNKDIVPVKAPRSELKKLKELGFTTSNKSLFVNKRGAKKVLFDKKTNTIKFKMPGRTYIAYPYDTSLETFYRVESFFNKRKSDQYMTFKIGDRNNFHQQIIREEDFIKYLEQFNPKDPKTWDFLMVVEMTDDEYDSEDEK